MHVHSLREDYHAVIETQSCVQTLASVCQRKNQVVSENIRGYESVLVQVLQRIKANFRLEAKGSTGVHTCFETNRLCRSRVSKAVELFRLER